MQENFRYFIHLAYDGSFFNGWQVQINAPSVQQSIENALSMLLKQNISVTGAGRTDTGVHARNYYAHFNFGNCLNHEELSDLVYHLNKILPDSIAVFKIFLVDADVHARFSATSRTYIYQISSKKNPFIKNYAWYYSGFLDIDLMNEASSILLKHQDFTSFCKKDTDVDNKLCNVYLAKWTEVNNMFLFEIKANRFLRNMVRSIVGTMVDIGRGKRTPEELNSIILLKNRCEAGYSAPAHGLFLENIEYANNINFIK